MKIIKTKIKGLYVLEDTPIADGRGYFTRIFCADELKKAKIDFKIVQMNHSLTDKKGTIRGMHFQTDPKSEAKVVKCLKGRVYDVAVDLRPRSKTYRQWFAVELSETNHRALCIPKGFAHGLQTLTRGCLVQYLMSEFYSPQHAFGLRWDDPALKIKWPLPASTLSEKDKNWPFITRLDK